MSTGYLDLFIEQGEDFSATIELSSYSNSSYDLTNYYANSQIRRSHWSANASDIFITSMSEANNGKLILSISAANTQNLKYDKYVYDLFLTNAQTNKRSKILEGMIYINPSCTKI